jgi:phosphoglycerate dehydrogenase-like enzyme
MQQCACTPAWHVHKTASLLSAYDNSSLATAMVAAVCGTSQWIGIQPGPRRRQADTLCHGCSTCDVVTINCPLHEGTRGLFNKELIGKMKPGSYLVRPCSACRAGMLWAGRL